MSGGADTPPPRVVSGGIGGVGASADVAKLACPLFPHRPMSFPDTHHGVGDLVQKDLVYLVILGAGGQIP